MGFLERALGNRFATTVSVNSVVCSILDINSCTVCRPSSDLRNFQLLSQKRAC